MGFSGTGEVVCMQGYLGLGAAVPSSARRAARAAFGLTLTLAAGSTLGQQVKSESFYVFCYFRVFVSTWVNVHGSVRRFDKACNAQR